MENLEKKHNIARNIKFIARYVLNRQPKTRMLRV